MPKAAATLPTLAVAWLLAGPAAAPGLCAQEAETQAYAEASAFEALAESSGLKATGAFPFDYQYLAFDAGAPGAVDVWAAASVHAGRVRGVFDGGWRYSLSVAVELFRGDSLVASDSREVDHVLNARIPSYVSDGFPLQAVVTVPPGEYEYRLAVRDLNWPENRAVNVKEGHLTVPAFDPGRPVVSSIAIAADSGGTWRPAPGVNLKLNAAAIVLQTARPFIYYEVYGLTPGGTYRGEVRLVSTWVSRGRGEQFTGPYQPFQMQFRGTAPADPTMPLRSVMRLDMKDTQPGPYEVQVRVTDVDTGVRSALRKARLKVRAPDLRRPSVPITEIEPDRGPGASEER